MSFSCHIKQKKYSLKQAVPMRWSILEHYNTVLQHCIYTLEKRFSAADTFQHLKVIVFFSKRAKKLARYSVFMSPLWISRDEKTKQLLFMRSRFIFVHVDKCTFFLKNSSLKWWLCSLQKQFCGGHKNNFVYNFVAPRLHFA